MGSAGAAHRPQELLRGATLIVGVAFMISSQDVIYKLFSASLSLGQMFTLRCVMAVPLLLAWAAWQGRAARMTSEAFHLWPLLRAGFLTLSFLAFYGAIPFISLSTLGAGAYTAPIFIALLSAGMLGEPVGLRGWAACLLGFAGVIVLLQPGTDAFSPWATAPIVGALLYALAHVITRKSCQDVSSQSLAMSLQLTLGVAGLAVTCLILLWQPGDRLVEMSSYLFGSWAPIGTPQAAALFALAFLAVAIGVGIAAAYKVAPPAFVATFEYTYLIFAAAWDILIFDTRPGPLALLGMVMIVGAGLLLARRKTPQT